MLKERLEREPGGWPGQAGAYGDARRSLTPQRNPCPPGLRPRRLISCPAHGPRAQRPPPGAPLTRLPTQGLVHQPVLCTPGGVAQARPGTSGQIYGHSPAQAAGRGSGSRAKRWQRPACAILHGGQQRRDRTHSPRWLQGVWGRWGLSLPGGGPWEVPTRRAAVLSRAGGVAGLRCQDETPAASPTHTLALPAGASTRCPPPPPPHIPFGKQVTVQIKTCQHSPAPASSQRQ